jgi:hypothetical protein
MKAELQRALSFALLCMGWLAALNLPVQATSVIIPTDEEMLVGARAVVRGQVTGITSGYDAAHRGIFTYVTLNVSDVFKGPLGKGELIIKEPGGQWGTQGSMIFGTPQFSVGEQVLLYLDTWPDGSLRVYQWFLGKFTITNDRSTGKLLLKRDVPTERIDVIGRSTAGIITDRADLDAYVNALRKNLAVTDSAARLQETRYYRNVALNPRPAELNGVSSYLQNFTLINNYAPPRWFEPDAGQPVIFKINTAGAYHADIVADIEAAFAAWSKVPNTSLRLVNGGSTNGCGLTSLDNENTVSFNNCDNYSAFTPPAGWTCSGILAAAGIVNYNSAQSKVINGITFYRGVEANLAFNPYAACYFTKSCNIREVAVHEIGHALGIGHSLDTNATMYAYAHFDERCASLRTDDENAVRFIYPGNGTTPPPTPTPTPVPTPTPTPKPTPTPTPVPTPTPTPVPTPTPTPKPTPTPTPVPTPTPTPKPTPTPTPVPTPTPTPVPAATGTLTANPSLIRVCDNSGAGATTFNWATNNVSAIEIHIGSPSGTLLTRGGAAGSLVTGQWITQGLVFYLQNISNGLPLTAANTLATFTANLTTQGCTVAATGALSLTPTPIQVCDGSGLGAGMLSWSAAGVTNVEVHLGAPNGPLVASGGASGTAATGKVVADRMTFYLQNVSNGLPLTNANTIATAQAALTTNGCSTGTSPPIWATPSVIKVCDGSGAGIAKIAWETTRARVIEIRVGAPNGRLLYRGSSRGASITGKWVTNGMTFYLQDATLGNATHPSKTLGTVSVSVTSTTCSP